MSAIEVIQADRDAWQSMLGNYGPEIDRMVALGVFDDDTRMAALAAHRIASETALRERVAVLERALREPTEAMWEAAWKASQDYFVADKISAEGFRKGLGAMLAALTQEPKP